MVVRNEPHQRQLVYPHRRPKRVATADTRRAGAPVPWPPTAILKLPTEYTLLYGFMICLFCDAERTRHELLIL